MQWTTISRLIDERDHAGLTGALFVLTPEERKAFAKPLQEKGSVPRGDFLPWETQPFYALAGAAILPSPSSLAAWLRRLELEYWVEPADPGEVRWRHQSVDVVADVLRLLEARGVDWRGDLAGRLAAAIRVTRMNRHRYELVDRLRLAADAPPPSDEGYLVSMFTWGGAGSFVEHARVDPRFAALAPRLAEVDGIGDRLDAAGASSLAAAAADGLVDRTALLDAVIGRLQRGGRPQSTRGFLHLYTALAPTLDELAARQRDLVALLADSPSFVAGVAQEQLAAVDDAGRLSAAVLLEATTTLLRRTEKKLVRPQLQRLTAAVRDGRLTPGAAALAGSVAFALAAVDLQRDAVKRVVGWSPDLDAAQRADVALAAADLPADLRADVHRALGTPEAPGVAGVSAPEPAPRVSVRRFARAAGPVELAEEFLALDHAGHQLDAMAVERQVEGLVRFARSDRAALRAAFAPVRSGDLYVHWVPSLERDGTRRPLVTYALAHLVASAVGDPAFLVGTADPRQESPLQSAVLDRIAVLASDLRLRPGPLVVSYPSDERGVITPADLLDRLGVAALEGWEPWVDDLDLALLRLDRSAAVGPTGAEAFADLGSAAGRAVAARLAEPPPQVPVTVGPVDRVVPDTFSYPPGSKVEHWYLPRVGAPSASTDHGRFWARASTSVDPADTRRMWLGWVQFGDAPACWAAALPWHPELVASAVAALYAIGVTHANPCADALVPLCASPGEIGDAAALAVALAASGKVAPARSAATDAILVLAADDRLDGARFGLILADLLDGGHVTTARVLGPLRDATDSGAAAFVWSALASALPVLLLRATPLPKLADVLELAAAAAVSAQANGPVAGLAEFAARKGSSRQLVEARRLRDLLAPGV